MFPRTTRILLLILVSAIILFPEFKAWAQDDYPNRPIEIVVPWAAGTVTDLAIRFYADKWAEFLRQPVVVSNKVGAGGLVGSKFVATANSDGYTLLAMTESSVISSRLAQKNVGFDLDSFRVLFIYSKVVLFFSVKSDSKWKTLHDFIREATNNPDRLQYGATTPTGSIAMGARMLFKAANIKLTAVPFVSSPDSLTALIGGNIEMAVTLGLSGLAKAGMVRPLAVSSEERLPDYPEVPTLKELGYPIAYTLNPNALGAPSKTPENAVSKLIEAHNRVRSKYSRDIDDKLPSMGQYPIYIEEKNATKQFKEREQLFREYYKQIGLKPE